MAISGFEGYEKRLELHFFGDDPTQAQKKTPNSGPVGLRQLDFDTLQQVLDEVQCTVVSALATWQLDSYVLSESSLFVYPNKVIIKTCGTTQLLKSVRPLVHHAAKLGLTLISLRYTRGDFIFPDQQPFPHTSFHDEIFFLNTVIPADLVRRKASVMDSWNVFSAAINEEEEEEEEEEENCTIEICMTELDRSCAERFYLREGGFPGGDTGGREMTEISGIGRIVAGDDVCDYAFDPCGYSMNSIDLFGRYSTVHVTPEDGFSYASFETVVFSGAGKGIDAGEIARVVRGVERVFRPAKMSVAVTGGGEIAWRRVAAAMEIAGMKRRSWAVDDFPAAGDVVYQTFASRRKP